ncbi:ATP-binding protein [Streptomyces olivaceoviridis]|uniref:ATP-binding protein n=1 Tax=Streptomyces olivaceoviridis TaxID=1921 RepID=UPI0007189489|nr:Regulatory protein [Streptomyces hygroscopicus subsp. limoneus]
MHLLRQRRFPRSRRSVAAARVFAVETLTEWGYLDRHDDVRLCVSELATNAVLHGVPPGREFCVAVVGDGSSIRLEVRDSGGGQPKPVPAEVAECRGRGLHLVTALADDFGVTVHNPGKTVWTVFKNARSGVPEARDGSI